MPGLDPAIIGIDGGATRSFGVALSPDGDVLAVAEGGSLNFFGAGLVAARATLRDLLRQLGVEAKRVRGVIGCAALFEEATADEKAALCRDIVDLAAVRLVSDCDTAHFGALLGRPGVIVISGTGSMVRAENEAGQVFRAGGWGHLVGDEGSAYWIAREAIRACIAAAEGYGTPTGMTALVEQWLEVRSLKEIVPRIHHPAFTKDRFASLARFLGERMGPDDRVWVQVRQEAGRLLARQTEAALRMAGFATSPVPVCLMGGVLARDAVVAASLKAHLRHEMAVAFVEPALEPALGAAALALKDFGLELTEARLAKLRASVRGRSPTA
ncbi:MAG TPA: BadF/BadG/BcrA/BcrD ATPase family protein [Methylomirabilota bacterium]|nr:BadF/BadG/BcrA/BcrD ATPase family protein [Methylomirabilota bacterium]